MLSSVRETCSFFSSICRNAFRTRRRGVTHRLLLSRSKLMSDSGVDVTSCPLYSSGLAEYASSLLPSSSEFNAFIVQRVHEHVAATCIDNRTVGGVGQKQAYLLATTPHSSNVRGGKPLRIPAVDSSAMTKKTLQLRKINK